MPINEELTKRIKELEDRLAKDSHNSSKPPSTDLVEYQLIPYGRTEELLEDIFGTCMSEVTIQSTAEECYNLLEQTEHKIKEQINSADVAHFDETGMYVADKRKWVHVASTEKLTHYGCHLSRGKKATDEIGILLDNNLAERDLRMIKGSAENIWLFSE